jgi:hypothetical protein
MAVHADIRALGENIKIVFVPAGQERSVDVLRQPCSIERRRTISQGLGCSLESGDPSLCGRVSWRDWR